MPFTSDAGTPASVLGPEAGERLGELLGLARRLDRFETRDEILSEIVAGACHVVPGAEHAGVSLRESDGSVHTLAPTDDRVAEVDAAQAELGEGPCMDAISVDPIVSVPDLSEDARWPRFTARALGVGLVCSLSFRLFTDRRTLGALNLHATTRYAFTEEARALGELVAAHTAYALGVAGRTESLARALEYRDVIGQAKGILMARDGIGADEAFTRLVRASQHSNIKLRNVAEWLVAHSTEHVSGSRER